MTFFQLFIIGYVVLFFGVVLGVRILLVRQKTGVNPVIPHERDGIKGIVRLFAFFGQVCLISSVICYAFLMDLYQYFVPIFWMELRAVHLSGVYLLIVAMVLIVVAQIQMGTSWRAGLDHKHRTELVEIGLFKVSRNPIYVGLKLVLLGVFFVVPNAVSLVGCSIGFFSIHCVVALEERFLLEMHGDAYQSYCDRVRRWV